MSTFENIFKPIYRPSLQERLGSKSAFDDCANYEKGNSVWYNSSCKNI